MLNTLKFKVAFPTVYMFAQQIKIATMCDERTGRVASFLMDMTLQDYSMLQFTPSMLAAACVNLAERCCYTEWLLVDSELSRLERTMDLDQKVWSDAQEQWVGYTEDELRPCMQCVDDILASPRELKAVRKKYSSSKWGKVATTVVPLQSCGPIDLL